MKVKNNGTASLYYKEKLDTIMWILKNIQVTNRNFIPLRLLSVVVSIGKIFLPIILMTPFLDSLMNKSWETALFWGVLLAALTFILGIIERTLYWSTELIGRNVSNEMRAHMHLRPLEIDYASSRDTEEKKRFQSAFENMNYGIGDFHNIVFWITDILTNFLSILLAMFITVWMLAARPTIQGLMGKLADPWICSLAAVITLLIIITFQKKIIGRFAKEKRDYLEKHASVEQISKYYVYEIGRSIKNYALYQLYDMLPMLDIHIERTSAKTRDFFCGQSRLRQKEEMIQGFVAMIILLLAYGLVGLKVLSGSIPAAMIVTCANSFIQMNSSFSSLVMTLGNIDHSLVYFRDIQSYMNRENLYATGSIPVEKRSDYEVTLSFEDVGFKYPGMDKWVLRNVTLTLDMKKKHAIVGPNGAGKTTFILLLCRLYEPTEGRILLNGVDIQKYDYEEYLSLFSVVFQDFQLFAFPVGENVACAVSYDENIVRKALVMAGFGEVLRELDEKNSDAPHKGVSSSVSTHWGSEENFSRGEQQKIAIARALAKSGSVVIMDEPTAALDPISEADIYEHLNDLIEDKTAVFISHRMSSCRFCQDIIVFDKGLMVERGTHEVLLEEKGLYHTMWNAQAKYYQEQGV